MDYLWKYKRQDYQFWESSEATQLSESTHKYHEGHVSLGQEE